MPRKCPLTGKQTVAGRKYSHRGKAKRLGGVGIKVTSKTKRTFKASMDWTATASASIETTVSYSSGPGEDKVVFSSVPFDVYYYEVISSPDPKAVGETITINLPREPQTFSVSRTFFNDNNGEAMDIDERILPHTIGDPWSYDPSRVEARSSYAPAAADTGEVPVTWCYAAQVAHWTRRFQFGANALKHLGAPQNT